MKLSKRRLVAFVVVAGFIIAGLGWYFESPAWTLSRMKAAAEANDPDALSAYIDYPALREDFKAEVSARMMAEAQKDKSGFGALGMAIGSAMVGPMIDRIVSPQGIRAALIAKHNQQRADLHTPASALVVPDQPVIKRRSFSEFLVTTKRQPSSGLVFKRHGLSWKLSGVDLSPES